MLQTYCHSALQPPNVFSSLQLAVPSHGLHYVKAALDRNLPAVHLDYAELASFVHIHLVVCSQRSHAAPAESLPGGVDRRHQVRAPVAPVIAASLRVL